jgi:hypothetical protein
MKPRKEGIQPGGGDQLETYGSPIHHFESTFQPRKKPAAAAPAPPEGAPAGEETPQAIRLGRI